MTKPKVIKRKKPAKKVSEMELLLAEMKEKQSTRPGKPKAPGKKDIDLMLEEFKTRGPSAAPLGPFFGKSEGE